MAKEPIDGVKPAGSSNTVEQGGDEVSQSVGRSVSREGGVLTPEGGFKPLTPRLSNVLQSRLLHMEGGYQSIRLPGSSRVIHDRREMPDGDRDVSREMGKPDRSQAEDINREQRIRDGKTENVRDKKYENYLGDRQFPFAARPAEQKISDRKLSMFEELVVKHFEEGQAMEQAIKDGKISFLAKTIEQWRAFFQKFLDRSAAKSVELSEVQEFLFRGMVKKNDAKAIVISDLIHNSGKTEKFIRFGVIYQKIASLLSKLSPGDTLAKQAIADGLTTEKLMYLALNPPSAEAEFFTGLKPTQGMFGLEATEARVAEELGIARDKGAPAGAQQSFAAKGKKHRTGGLWRWLVGDEEVPLDDKPQFIPWWQWGTLNRPGGFTLKRAFYSGVIIIFILTILFLAHQYLLGK